MISLHLSRSPWFLLLLAPGLFLLARIYLGRGRSGNGRQGLLLFVLQATALLLLVVSLTAPELRRHRIEFHNPAVVILRDQSGSFRNGDYLRGANAYGLFQKNLMDEYRKRNFDVRVADFHERAWPVSGFAGVHAAEPPHDSEATTSLAAAADFLDSATIPNLQGVFLFSDGRSNLDSGQAPRSWKVPVYPVVIPPESISELQPERVNLAVTPGAKSADVQVLWRTVGKAGGAPTLKLLQAGKIKLSRKLETAEAGPDGALTFRFSWPLEKPLSDDREPILAVLQPANPEDDYDAFNDTLAVSLPGGGSGRRIHFLKPIRSLDEKGMVDILEAWEGTSVDFLGAEEIPKPGMTARDEIWIEAGMAAQGDAAPAARLLAALQASPAKIVIYARQETGVLPSQLAGLRFAWQEFPSGTDIRVEKSADEDFPDEVVRVKNISAMPMQAPEESALNRQGAVSLVHLSEGNRRGTLMGRIPLGKGKRAFFFILPSIWKLLFDPQSDYATRENIGGYVKAAAILGAIEDQGFRVAKPARAYEGVPFDLEIRAPAVDSTTRRQSKIGNGGSPSLSITGAGYAKEWPLSESGTDAFAVKTIVLARGRYLLELRAASAKGEAAVPGEDHAAGSGSSAATLWRDSLEVAPKAALELARIGFDAAGLNALASHSGGNVLNASFADAADSARVTSMLPKLPAAQIRMEQTRAFPLYNTRILFGVIFLLLALSWLLRKKWDFD